MVWNRQKRGLYGHHPHVPEPPGVWRCQSITEPWLWLPGVMTVWGDAPPRVFGAGMLVVRCSPVPEITSLCLFPPPSLPNPAAWPRWRACCPGAWGSAPCSAPASRRPTGCWRPPRSTPCPPTSAARQPTRQRTDPARSRRRRAAGHPGSPAPGITSSAPGSKCVRRLLARGNGGVGGKPGGFPLIKGLRGICNWGSC